MSNKTFTVAGVSTLNNVCKPRFSNEMEQRLAMLTYTEHTDIKLVELPAAMTKLEAVQHLQAHEAFQDEVSQAALAAFVAKNTPKAAGKRGRPMKLPTLAEVPTRENGKFLSKEAREAILQQMIADVIAAKEAARAKREARAAAKAAEAPAEAPVVEEAAEAPAEAPVVEEAAVA